MLFCLACVLIFPLTASAQYRTNRAELSGSDQIGLSHPGQPELSSPDRIELSSTEQLGPSHPEQLELSSPDRIKLSHGNFYDQNGVWLDEAQVRSLFGDDIYQETFVGARKQYRAGRNLLTGGLIVIGAGVACALLADADIHAPDFSDEPGYPRETHDHSAEDRMFLGALIVLAGGTAINVGIPLMIIGTRRLAWMEDEYNSRPKHAWSLAFRQTRNGAGLVLSF
jgi:hypothetical protein